MRVNLLRFSWRMLRRERKAGELRILALATVIAVAATGAVSLFTDRLRAAMQYEAGELLAADLLVSRPAAIPEAWTAEAQARGLDTAHTVEFRSMVMAGGGEGLQLAEIKAVDDAYPLRGELRARPEGRRAPPDAVVPGRVWLAPELAQRIASAPGESVDLGETRLRVDALIGHEPDRGGELFSIAPRLLMHLDDLPATGLVQPGSTIQYRLLMAGSDAALSRFREWLAPRLEEGDRLLGVREARPEIRLAMERAERFTHLAALVSVVLAGVAVAMAARRYARRQLDASAVMRCLGASAGLVFGNHLLQLFWIWLFSALFGAAVAWLAQGLLGELLAGVVAAELPPASPGPLIQGMVAGGIMLFGFALPPLLVLRQVPPLRVLRRDLAPRPVSRTLAVGVAAVALLGLLAWQVRDAQLIAYVALGTAGALAVLAGTAWLLVQALGGLRGRSGLVWRFGVAGIARRAGSSVVQTASLGVGIMVLLVLALVRGDLLDAWQDRLPPETPNRFLINIQPGQVESVRALLRERGLVAAPLYPMVRGRLVAINQEPVRPADYGEPRAQRLVQREFNLSWAERLKPDNQVVAGRWWGAAQRGEPLLSVEEGIAETLGIGLGDELTFRVADRTVTAEVTSLRAVDWDSFRANFFVLAAPGVLDGFPASYISSFYLPPGQEALTGELVRAFPNITVLDVGAILEQVRGIMTKVTQAVEFVFLFTLLAGFVVLYAAIQASHEERVQEGAVLRTLGASRALIRRAWQAEFLLLGTLAGALAALLATVLAWVLAEQVFELPFRFNPWIWVWGLLGGAFGTLGVGLLGTRKVLRRPPLEVLRSSI